MRLRGTVVFLMALTWTRADPSPSPGSEPESAECDKFEILKDKRVVLGRFYSLVSFANDTFSHDQLRAVSNIWADLVETQTGVEVTQFQKINGTCAKYQFNITINGDTATATMFGTITELQLLNFSENAIMMDLKASTPNVTNMSERKNGHNFYLIGKEPAVSETDLQRFKAFAKCAGFTGEPHFILKSGQEFCTEEESVLINVNAK